MATKLYKAPSLAPLSVTNICSHGPYSKFGHDSKPTIRAFHATARRPFVDECLIQTHAFISGLHDFTGLTWAASIPLTAIVVRAFVLFPIEWHSRSKAQKFERIIPRIEEARRVIAQRVAQANMGKSAYEKERIVAGELGSTFRKLVKENGLQEWKFKSALYLRFPVWLIMMESLRRMTGAQENLLGLVGKSVTGGQITRTSDVNVIPIEHSLVVEGMLWFPNLQLPDPALVLPFILSTVLFISIRYATLATRTAIGPTPVSIESRNLRRHRAAKILALAAGPATLKFPSLMLLYGVSSGLCSLGSKYLLLKWMPIAHTSRTQNKKTADPKMQQFRGPTMGDLRTQKKKQKKK